MTMPFDHQHEAGLGVVLADGRYVCHDCISERGEHHCHGADGAAMGAPVCSCGCRFDSR